MAEKKRIYRASVRLVIDVEASGVWGDDCHVSQIEDQAAREAEAALQHALDRLKSNKKIIGSVPRVRTVEVLGVFIETEKSRK